MKKILFIIILVCGVLIPSFSQSISIKDIVGKVELVSGGKNILLTKDTKIDNNSFIITGINSKLIIDLDGKIFTIKPMTKGFISKIIAENKINTRSSIIKSEINSNDTKERIGISTASTRASDATKDVDWVEE